MQTDSFAPDYPAEGRLTRVPILATQNGNNTYDTGTLTVVTTAVVSAVRTFQTQGIPYAELRLVGVEFVMTATGPVGMLPGFEVTNVQGGGKIQALYGNQLCLLDGEGYATAATAATATYYGKLNIIGLRDKAEIEKTNVVEATVRVFANTAVNGTVRWMLNANAVFNTLEDDSASSSD